jgi:hypothetical protein
MRYLLYILLFAGNLVYSQQEDEPFLEVWTLFSDNSFVNSNAHRIASKNWPFTIYSMSGDVILDEKIVDSVQKNNQTVWQYLDSHGHENSEKEYLQEYYTEKREISKAIKISQAQLDLSKYKPKETSYLHAKFYVGVTKIKEHIYQFSIFVIDYNKPYSQEEIILKYQVNTEKEEITILKNTT